MEIKKNEGKVGNLFGVWVLMDVNKELDKQKNELHSICYLAKSMQSNGYH